MGLPANISIRDYIGAGCAVPAPSSCVPANASPVNLVTADDPPMYLLYSNQDERVPLSAQQHTQLATRAQSVGVAASTTLVDTVPTFDGDTTSYHNGTVDEFDKAAFEAWLATL